MHVESMDQAADLFTKMLSGRMFEALANVVVGSKRRKPGTVIDRHKRRGTKGGGGTRKPSSNPIFFLHGCLQVFKKECTRALYMW